MANKPSRSTQPGSSQRQARFARWLHRQWQHRGWLARLLWPLAACHGLILRLRRLAYQRGWLARHQAPVPVVVVGNILVGGTGKTPLLIALVTALRELGWQPGVISRGYGARAFGANEGPRLAQSHPDPHLLGDEPALIAERTGVGLAVHPQRALAARALCQARPEINLILADDGLQHLGLQRDIELVVQDHRGVGNGWLLPAGPLREPPARLGTVAAIITNLPSPEMPLPPPPAGVRTLGMVLQAERAIRLSDGEARSLQALREQTPPLRIAAVAGIGQPERFFTTLRQHGLALVACRALPDHDNFRNDPFADLPADIILITDKDAVKCRENPDTRLWRVPVSAVFTDPGFVPWLNHRLHAALSSASTPSPSHGSSPD